MRILDQHWRDNYLDYAMLPHTYRIQVARWCVLSQVAGMYFSPARDWRLVWNYLREYGFTEVLRKVNSRKRESLRNKKYAAFGVGTVVECGASAAPLARRTVAFLAPAHPRCVERLVLPEELVLAVDDALLGDRDHELTLVDPFMATEQRWRQLVGWNQYSGVPLSRDLVASILTHLVRELNDKSARQLSIEPPSPVREFLGAAPELPQGSLRGVVFGLGHYAKTNILPKLHSRIRIVKVHEIDPTQLAGKSFAFQIDSSPKLRPGERFDVFFLAGFHHTHAPLAVDALRGGAFVVVEKPLATTWADLNELLDSLRAHPGKLFAGFHKRYSELNDVALSDLGVRPGQPVSYHCLVHEAPLPELHWYRWPNSCSRLLSNGCHWIDHFLYLNQFDRPVLYDVWESSGGDMNVVVELANGASFTMTLTDRGSSRIGVEDYIELRSGDVTVRMVNSSSYRSEDSRRVLRRMKVNRARSYATMYATISKRIANADSGDSLEMVERSAKTVLDLENRLTEFRAGRASLLASRAGK